MPPFLAWYCVFRNWLFVLLITLQKVFLFYSILFPEHCDLKSRPILDFLFSLSLLLCDSFAVFLVIFKNEVFNGKNIIISDCIADLSLLLIVFAFGVPKWLEREILSLFTSPLSQSVGNLFLSCFDMCCFCCLFPSEHQEFSVRYLFCWLGPYSCFPGVDYWHLMGENIHQRNMM